MCLNKYTNNIDKNDRSETALNGEVSLDFRPLNNLRGNMSLKPCIAEVYTGS